MTTINLLPQSEKLSPENPWNLHPPPLYHQWRTHQGLADYDLVVNAYNTGTGKTIASLLHLFDLDKQGKNVLFIAPTNALIHQHTADIESFAENYDLDFRVVKVHAAQLRVMMEQGDRPGETLQRLIQNPLTYAEALGIPLDDHRKLPIVLVVNPDIFYYALYFRYGSHDQRNVFEKILTAFDYIVIDEFHYYNSKQLASFLFFFVISQEFGYFERGRRICLLSATPNPYVEEYLGRVFGDRWALLTPQNEPAESLDLSTTPVLTSLRIELVEGEIQDWVIPHRREIGTWLDAEQDGALISSALWRVNTCYTALRGILDEGQLGRITGPEPEKERVRATGVPLILATPTVDIGYNFRKQDKKRQNIDFLVCDARYGDELLQRLGRAGRVLGKVQKDQASRAVAILPSAAYRRLADYDGETLSRAEFAALVEDMEALPPKQSLYAYVRTHAITECFYPIFQVKRMLRPELQERAEALYERVREVFAPSSERPSWSLRAYFGKYWGRKRWLRTNKSRMSTDYETAVQVVDWLEWVDGTKYDPTDWMPHLEEMTERAKKEVRDFVAGQVHLTEALFNFRDSFQGPVGVVYDRDHLLSSETINAYDLMHLVSNYQIHWLDGRREFVRSFGKADLRGELYGVIREWLDPRLTLELYYDSTWPRAEFDERVCRRPVALRGLKLTARERGGDRYPLDPRIAGALGDRYVTAMGIKPEDNGIVYGRFKGTTLFPRRLTVTFRDGQQVEDYRIFLGTQAFQAHAELLGYFYMRESLKSEAIIV